MNIQGSCKFVVKTIAAAEQDRYSNIAIAKNFIKPIRKHFDFALDYSL